MTIQGDSTGSQIEQGVINALIIIACIIVVTIILVVLFYYGFHKVLFGFILCTIMFVLGGEGGLFIWYEIQSVNGTLDYLTFAFVIWNFSVVGLWVLFKSGPLLVQQGYLIILSALMAFVFTQIDEWTTWLLLVLLVLWGKSGLLFILPSPPPPPMTNFSNRPLRRADPLWTPPSAG